MEDLRGLSCALVTQRRRLAELVELCGGVDPEHPLVAFSLRWIEWLEEQIKQKQKKRADP